MGYLGIDIERAAHLADLLARWPAAVDDAQYSVTTAESLADMHAGVSGHLAEIGATGQAAARALHEAIDLARSFRIDPRLAVLVDRPFGSVYAPRMAYRAMAAGETYAQTELRDEIDARDVAIDDVPPARRRQIEHEIAELRARYDAIDPPQNGDRGGTLTTEIRSPFSAPSATPFDAGVGVVAHALADTSDSSQVQVDEFQVIFHNNAKLTLVLPGVADLRSPGLGLNSVHRTARDLDQHAVPSSFDSTIASNRYAQLVVQWLEAQVATGAIAPGASVLVVGHSFGADTALDLASDTYVNGSLVTITHVIAAGYHSEPQLDDVVNNTQVGVLQNIYDLTVLAEGVASDLTGVPGLGLAALKRPRIEVTEEVISWLPGVPDDFELLGDVVRVDADAGFVAEFEGGFDGAGHHQTNYIDFVESAELPQPVVEILTDIGRAGYGASGVSVAVDISVPEEPAVP